MSFEGVDYLSVDPGKTVGFAHWNSKGDLLYADQLQIDDFILHMEELNNLTAIMYETYRVDPKLVSKTFGSLNEASQCVGAIRSYCLRNQIPKWPVERHTKSEGYKWAGLRPATNHAKSHSLDAIAIGKWWLVTNKVITKGTLSLDAY